MAVLGIRIIGDPILRTPAAPVTSFGPELRKLVRDMEETMIDVQGAGLAAPQVGVDLQVFTYRIDGRQGYVINPVLELGAEPAADDHDVEGCLSVPGLGSFLPRSNWARVTGVDTDGNPVEVEGTGMLARCLQHETDHLQGRLYIDRLTGADKREAMRAIRSAGYNDVVGQTAAQRARSLGSVFAGQYGGASTGANRSATAPASGSGRTQ